MANDENLVDDQYQLAMCIASGSSSQVWEVVEMSSGRHMAMKLLKTDVPEFKENKAQMKRESEIHKLLDHPQIVKFERFSSNRDHTYILMEYFRASNLKLQIKADTNGVHLKIRQLFEGVCAALSHVHQKGFIHRDIKPDNVLMNKVGEIRLCDFSLSSKQKLGIGKLLAGKLKSIQGTRTYIAPETIRRTQPSFQTDLYSLGVLFFEVLACKTPFQAPTPEELLQKHLRAEAPNPSEFNPNVSPEMDRIIAKLLKKKPADRPASADEVLAELKRIRIFKEDIVDAVAEKKANQDKDALTMLSEIRLDSRADAKLKEMLETNPEFARKFAEEKESKAKKKKAESALNDARIKVAETAEAARGKPGKPAPAPAATPAPAAPQPQPATVMQMPMPMPMQMPGYPPGFPQYPQGYAGYPPGQVPIMPGMAAPMPGVPQYGPQPPMGYPQPMQQPLPGTLAQQPVQTTPPPGTPKPQPQPISPQTAAAKGVNATPPVKKPVALAPKPTTKPGPPAPAPAKPVVSAKPAVPVPTRPTPPPTPPPSAGADLDFMTDLPDVL